MTVSIGVEEEFHLVDVAGRRLVPGARAVLERLPEGFTGEFRQSVVESNSGVHETLDALHADLVRSRRSLDAAAAPLGLAAVAAGTVPLARVSAVGATPDPRYLHMADEYRLLADEQLICGAQVHVDVPDRDTAVRAMCLLSPWLPVLLALSASSPFWLGQDTGYASWRTPLWQRWPTTGPAGCFGSAAEYDAAVDSLVRSGAITDAGMVYFDVRPSAHLGTLELRICDACPDPETVVLIAGLFRALVVEACEAVGREPHAPARRQELLRAASWRAARSGLEGELVHPETGVAAPAGAVVRSMLARLRPALEGLGDLAAVSELVDRALARGSAAARLRRIAAGDGLPAVVDALIAETRGAAGADRPAGAAPTRLPTGAAGLVRVGSGVLPADLT